MIKTHYYCDRCGMETTTTKGDSGLHTVGIQKSQDDKLWLSVCAMCLEQFLALAKPYTYAPKGVGY